MLALDSCCDPGLSTDYMYTAVLISDCCHVLCLRYVSDHDAKDAVDKELAKRAAADRYWQTRNYDPITATFLDKSKVAILQGCC